MRVKIFLPIIITAIILPVTLTAQTKLVGYEYWYNDAFSERQKQNITANKTHNFVQELDISSLPIGINSFHIRYIDSENRSGPVLSKNFVRIEPIISHNDDNKLVAFEYWYNDNFAERIKQSITADETHHFVQELNTDALPIGVNSFNFRYIDSKNKSGPVLSKDFIKIPPLIEKNQEIEITACRYWFDDDFDGAVLVTFTPASAAANWVGEPQYPEDFELGEHEINVQFQDSEGKWSVPLTMPFEFTGATGIESQMLNVRVFPNPSISEFKVDLGQSYKVIHYQLFNAKGQSVVSGLARNVSTLEISFNLSAGVYLLKLKSAEEESNFRVLIE